MESLLNLTINNDNGKTVLSYKKWYNEHQIPKATIFFIHDVYSHIERYNNICNTLLSNGYVVYGLDLREHGKNVLATLSDKYNTYIEDLNHLIKQAINDYPKNKIILIGHGIGSTIITRYTQLYPDSISGIILSSMKFNKKSNLYFKKILFNIAYKIKSKDYTDKFITNLFINSNNKKFKPVRTEFDWLNQNEAEVDSYINDNLCGNDLNLKISTIKVLNNLAIDTRKNLKVINKDLPIYIISGSHDSTNKFSKQTLKLKKKLSKLKIKNLKMTIYKNLRHEIFLEDNKQDVFSDILSWISKTIN